jgi:Domain of unknown function (DUF4410)
MKRLLVVVGLTLSTISLSSQARPVMVVNAFTTAQGVELPYDMKMIQSQLVAELRVMLGKDFDIKAEAPAASEGTVYTLSGEFKAWHPGNAAKRIVIGLGSGRESSDISYQLTDASGKKVVEHADTIRTNFYSQNAGSTGTLAHPIAQKISDRIRDAQLKRGK